MSFLCRSHTRGPICAADFGFEFSRSDEGWRWVAYDQSGAVAAQGVAPSKAVAAAFVIRELAGA